MIRQWTNLRSWEGSQEKAFEELCCQLAAAETIPSNSNFRRKGTPDAGVECFWTLPSGEEWAWQAKFFFQLQETQWRDLDESVQTALDKHPSMTRYVVCIPIDLADGRVTDARTQRKKTFAQDAWDLRVKKWTEWAGTRGRNVLFERWGNHEIWQRLTRDEHSGRLLFWFNEQWFSDEWFQQRLEDAYQGAGKRYLPSLHVTVDVEQAFDALGRTDRFARRLNGKLGRVRREFDHFGLYTPLQGQIQDRAQQLEKLVGDLCSLFVGVPDTAPLPLNSGAQTAAQASDLALQLIAELQHAGPAVSGRPSDRDASIRHRLYVLQDRLDEFRHFLLSPEATACNSRAILLVGEAGTGKTHLFCEVARQRQRERGPTVLLLGEQFVPGEPWGQLLTLLGLGGVRDEFLGALDAAAEARGCRAVILVDAINEEHGLKIWPKYLGAFLAQLRRYPRLAVAVSVRSSYESVVIPNHLRETRAFVRVVHEGFAGHEEQGLERYFTHYGIAPASLPVLDPEFSNPLFLRVLCESARNRGLTRIPEGLRGFTSVFEFFLDSVNEKLSNPAMLDYDPRDAVVITAVERLAAAMAAAQTDWIERAHAAELVNGVLPRPGHDRTLFRRLVDEGVLAAEVIPARSRVHVPGSVNRIHVVRFQYRRFADYLMVSHILRPHLATQTLEAAFAPGQFLAAVLADAVSCRRRQGLIEALAVVLPELSGHELDHFAPHCGSFESVKEAVTNSLAWRRADSISGATWTYIEREVLPDPDARQQLLRTLLLVAPDPTHPYNADFLHRWLLPMPLVARDGLWSTFLARDYVESGGTRRLLRWAASASAADPTTKRLTATVLTWLLTASARPLRDTATKALVVVFELQPFLAGALLAAVKDVNDGYVLERVAAAAYGAAMRSRDVNSIAPVAQLCYDTFFAAGKPPASALSRDYLRGVIELALWLKAPLAVKLDRIRPPYREAVPDSFSPHGGSYPDLDWNSAANWPRGLQAVHHSITADDFASYVLQPLSEEFLAAPLEIAVPPTRREMYEQFVQGLRPGQIAAWNKYKGPLITIEQLQDLLSPRAEGGELPERFGDRAREEFEATLSSRQRELFGRDVRPYLEESTPPESRPHIDLQAIKQFVLSRVLANGWSPELDVFDRSDVITYGRNEHTVERIGKKYQWIAFCELIGILADNYHCAGQSTDSVGKYEGPWQITYARNIDPSLVLRSKPERISGCWWSPKTYAAWAEELDELAWLGRDDDTPPIDRDFLFVLDRRGAEWVVLEGQYQWTEPPAPGRKYLELPQRQLSYTVTSCLARRRDAAAIVKDLAAQPIALHHCLEPRNTSDAFLGELHWSPAYVSQLIPYYGYEGWVKDSLPRQVLVTTEHYYAEPGSYDGSMDESITLVCPSHWIVEKMGLQWNGAEGEWTDAGRTRVLFCDPSARSSGPTALVARRDAFEKFLEEQDCALIWIVAGTKWALGGSLLNHRPVGRRLIKGALRLHGSTVKREISSWLDLPRR